MHLKIEINNLAKSPTKTVPIERIVALTLEKSGYAFLAKKNLSLSFAWIAEEEIKKINKSYRKKDKATDVLSFCEYENEAALKKSKEKELFLGELLLCYNFIRSVSLAEGGDQKDLKKELARIIAHGVLHLLGFSHGLKMFNIQDAVAEKF